MPNETDLAYTAGILDGEGFIGLPSQMTPQVRVQMNSEQVVRWLEKTFGGGVHKRAARPERNLEETYLWYLTGKGEVKEFLQAVLPYLQVKRLPAILVIEYCEVFARKVAHYSKAQQEERKRYCEVLKAANSRGPGSNTLKAKLLKSVS